MRASRMLVLVLVFILAAPFMASAVEYRTTQMIVAEIDQRSTYLFSIGWERGDLHVTLIAPDGTRIPQDEKAEGVIVAWSERITIFRVDDAKPGIWKAEFQEFDNGRVGVIVQQMISPLLVKNATASQIGNDIAVHFELSGEKDALCRYDVYLTTDGQYQNGRLLQNSTAKIGEAVSLVCPGEDISSFDRWQVSVYAECESEGFTDFHSASTSPFAFSNPFAPGLVNGLMATLKENSILVQWQPPKDVITGYLAVLYGEDGSVQHSVMLDREQTQADLPFSVRGKLKAEILSLRDSFCGLPAAITVDTSVTLLSLVGFDLPDNPTTADGYIELAYNTGEIEVPLSIEIDGQPDNRAILGNGVLRLPVRNGTIRLTLSAQGDDDIWVSQSKKYMIDMNPPVLRIFEDWDAMVTGRFCVMVSGNADCAYVIINDEVVKTESNGNFRKEVPLESGMNLLKVKAKDESGNTTVYEARVTRKDEISLPWLVLSLVVLGAFHPGFKKQTALILSIMMLGGSCAGTLKMIKPSIRPNMADLTGMEKRALVALTAGDPESAYDIAVESCVMTPGRPASWLIAARAAALSGDLDAAANYYGQLQPPGGQTAGDPILEEAAMWGSISSLPRDEQKKAAAQFTQALTEDIFQQPEAYPGFTQAVQNQEALITAREEFFSMQMEENSADSSVLHAQLFSLLGAPGAEEAREVLIQSFVFHQQWDALLGWLNSDGVLGLMDLVELVLDGSLPEGELARFLNTGSDEKAIGTLVGLLWEHRNDAGISQGSIYLALAGLNAILPEGMPFEMVSLALDVQADPSQDSALLIRQLNQLRLLGDTLDTKQADAMTLRYLEKKPHRPEGPSGNTEETLEEQWSEELSGETLRMDLSAFFNICAPEMIEAGHIRFYVTMAEGSSGFPGGEPNASDFAFRSNVGFQSLLNVNSMTRIDEVERYTMLLIDHRPSMTQTAMELAKSAALAYVRSMPEGEKVLVYAAGVPSQYLTVASPGSKAELFGNSEMETYLFSSDKAVLEAFIMSDYGGDAFDNPDIHHTISWPLNQMTAISDQGVGGGWDSFPLTSAVPRFGQVILFTNGDAGAGLIAGGGKTIEFIRGGAIAANAAVHIVLLEQAEGGADIQALAQAGRGSAIDPSTDSLTAFYNFVRNRQVRVFLADCSIPEYPVDDFFELRAQHEPSGVITGFKRNPGKGIDLIGTMHYSDAFLSSNDFQDYLGDDLTDSAGGDPFDNSGSQTGDSTDSQSGGTQTDNQGWYNEIEDWPGSGSLRVDGLDRHAIARNDGGLMLVNLLGQGFLGLGTDNVLIQFSDLGTISPGFLRILNDSTIQFFLPVTMPTGTYSMNVTIGASAFNFANTLFVYDADGFTAITMGEWTITASSAEEAGTGSWNLSGAVINDYVRFTGNTLVTGSWQGRDLTQLTLDPGGEAYIAFDPESDDFLVEEIFLEEGADLMLGCWSAITLEPSGAGVSYYAWQQLNQSIGLLSLGLIELPFDEGTMHPDRVEVPVLDINLDLPFQNYFLMNQGLLPCAADAEAMFTADIDSIDLQLTAGLKSEQGLKFMSALKISEFGFEIDTAQRRLAVDLGAELVSGKEFSAHIAFKGLMLDEIGLSLEVEIPLTTAPIPVSLTEMGGGLNGLSALVSGSISEILGMEIIAAAKFEAGSAKTLLPFLSSLPWLPADKIPPLLATKDTELKLRPFPFSLQFSTEISLFDEISIGEALLGIGQYSFNQALLDISDNDAIGLFASIQTGPSMDFSIIRLIYRSGPRIDINNHGFFLTMNGTAGLGVNIGPVELSGDMVGTFLLAIHDIPSSSWPQISIVANAAPTFSIPGLLTEDEEIDIRLLINNEGYRLIGLPSPLDKTLDFLNDQINAAAEETWSAISSGVDMAEAAASAVWIFMGDQAGNAMDLYTNGMQTIYTTSSDVLDQVSVTFSEGVEAAAEIANQFAQAGGQFVYLVADNVVNGQSIFISDWSNPLNVITDVGGALGETLGNLVWGDDEDVVAQSDAQFGVTFYQHHNQEGWALTRAIGKTAQTVNELGFPNDSLSCIKIDANVVPFGQVRVTLYQHTNYEGTYKVFNQPGTYNLGDFSFNDACSSYRIEWIP